MAYQVEKIIPAFAVCLIATLLGCASTMVTTTPPEFYLPGADGKVIVFDIEQYNNGKGYEDYIKINNSIPQAMISFACYGYDEKSKEWKIIGSVLLQRTTFTDTIHSPHNRHLNKFRWFAIQSLDGIDFRAEITVKRDNSIYIMVY
jgi:hypothetical protein